jgi:hypothetical protein
VAKLADVPDVKWSYSLLSKDDDFRLCRCLQSEHQRLDQCGKAIRAMKSSMATAEMAFAVMSPKERAKKASLASLAGIVDEPVLATPAEHLANMEMALANQEAQVKAFMARTMIVGNVRRRIDFASEYSFDARKTDSVTTPYTGTLEIAGLWRWIHRGGCHDAGGREYFRFAFAAQGEQWLLKMIERRRAGEKWRAAIGVPFLGQLHSGK